MSCLEPLGLGGKCLWFTLSGKIRFNLNKFIFYVSLYGHWVRLTVGHWLWWMLKPFWGMFWNRAILLEQRTNCDLPSAGHRIYCPNSMFSWDADMTVFYIQNTWIYHLGMKAQMVMLMVFISFSPCFSPAPVPFSLSYKDSHGKCPIRPPKRYLLHYQ